MHEMIRHAVNMLLYMLTALPICLLARGIFLKVKKKKINATYEAVLLIFVLFAVGMASQTVIPKFEVGANGFQLVQNGVHETNLMPFKVLSDTYYEVFKNGNITYFLINVLGNVVMFVPFGVFIPLLWKAPSKKTVWIGFFISLFIESCQLFLPRTTDVDDLILNTVGTWLGVLLFGALQKRFPHMIKKFVR